MSENQSKVRPKVVLKVVLSIVFLPVVFILLGAATLMAVFAFINAKGGIDVVKGKPDQAFQRFVLDVIPSGVKVVSAEGHAHPPLGGMTILFRLQIDEAALDTLITSKRLERVKVSKRKFGTNDLSTWKKPEFYSGQAPLPGKPSSTWGASMVVDRETGVVLYRTGGD